METNVCFGKNWRTNVIAIRISQKLLIFEGSVQYIPHQNLCSRESVGIGSCLLLSLFCFSNDIT